MEVEWTYFLSLSKYRSEMCKCLWTKQATTAIDIFLSVQKFLNIRAGSVELRDVNDLLWWYVNRKYADESIRLSFVRDNVKIVFFIQICVSQVYPTTSVPLYHCHSHIMYVRTHTTHTHTYLLDCHFRVCIYNVHHAGKRISDLSTTKHHIPCGNMSLIWYLFDLYEKHKWNTVQCWLLSKVSVCLLLAHNMTDYMALHIYTDNLSHLMGYQIDFYSSKNICIWLLNRFRHFQCRNFFVSTIHFVSDECAVPQIQIKSVSIISHLQTESVMGHRDNVIPLAKVLFVRFVIIFVSIHTIIKLKILFLSLFIWRGSMVVVTSLIWPNWYRFTSGLVSTIWIEYLASFFFFCQLSCEYALVQCSWFGSEFYNQQNSNNNTMIINKT